MYDGVNTKVPNGVKLLFVPLYHIQLTPEVREQIGQEQRAWQDNEVACFVNGFRDLSSVITLKDGKRCTLRSLWRRSRTIIVISRRTLTVGTWPSSLLAIRTVAILTGIRTMGAHPQTFTTPATRTPNVCFVVPNLSVMGISWTLSEPRRTVKACTLPIEPIIKILLSLSKFANICSNGLENPHCIFVIFIDSSLESHHRSIRL